VSSVTPYNPNIPPPPNPYTRQDPSGAAPRPPRRASRATAVLSVLLGLGVMVFAVPAAVLRTSDVMDHPLRWLALVVLLVLGPLLAFGKRPRSAQALGRGLLLGTLTGCVVAALLSWG
jgi:hypothetical protein